MVQTKETRSEVEMSLRAALRWILPEVLFAGLIVWFSAVIVTTLPDLRPQPIRTVEPARYDPYLDDFVVFYAAGKLARSGKGAGIYTLSAIQASGASVLGLLPDRVLV
ncbi:MAG: hypothetical protein ACR2PL_14620, partial [Dehalococcoidia bacterium]